MELRREVKLRTQPAKKGTTFIYVITLPKEYVEALGWQRGDRLEVVLDTDKREIRVRRAGQP